MIERPPETLKEKRMTEDNIQRIISALDHFDGTYKRAEMEEALTLKDEITPHLIRILEDLAADPREYAAKEHYANVYAAALLGYFQEPGAHLPIIRAFCINKEEREELWGDMVTETLPALLFLTCGGSLEAIKNLVLNRETYEFVRSSAVEALTYAVARGVVNRVEIIDFFSGLFTGTEAEGDSYFWCSLASALTNLHPGEALEIIRNAYDDDLVHEGYIRLKRIEEEAAMDKETVLNQFRVRVDRRIYSNIHSYLSWFACFRENEDSGHTLPGKKQLKTHKNKKTVKKTKKKITSASRKKNRR
ncbi:MAG: hypothetical protein C0392_02340 [Syntrophus sp. (in: bacteria)]|nr:hypothetical protein [Syntrophus sp. (in: bacteria)]